MLLDTTAIVSGPSFTTQIVYSPLVIWNIVTQSTVSIALPLSPNPQRKALIPKPPSLSLIHGVLISLKRWTHLQKVIFVEVWICWSIKSSGLILLLDLASLLRLWFGLDDLKHFEAFWRIREAQGWMARFIIIISLITSIWKVIDRVKWNPPPTCTLEFNVEGW